jgi:hypothetical protein
VAGLLQRWLLGTHQGAVALGISLVVGTTASLWEARKATVARAHADALRQSTDHAMHFLEAVLFSADTYNVRDQTLNLDFLLQQVEPNLPILNDDRRAKAIALGGLVRVASNWGKQDVGVRWLRESAELWRSLTNRVDSPDERERKAMLATVLNHLAWALVGNTEDSTGRSDRAKLAWEPAEEAYRLFSDTLGPSELLWQLFRALMAGALNGLVKNLGRKVIQKVLNTIDQTVEGFLNQALQMTPEQVSVQLKAEQLGYL